MHIFVNKSLKTLTSAGVDESEKEVKYRVYKTYTIYNLVP